MRAGRRSSDHPPLAQLRERCLAAVAELPAGVKRLSGWEAYDVRISDGVREATERARRRAGRDVPGN
jgi:hypothetical protein